MHRATNHPIHRAARLLVLIALVVSLAPALTVHAAGTTYYVGQLVDDIGIRTNECTSSTNITCTLRDALAVATSGMDTIQFDANAAFGVYQLGTGANQGTLVVAHSVTITGPGPQNLAIDGGYNAGTQSGGTIVFTVTAGASVTISGLEITHGNNQGVGGGGIYSNNGAGITLSNDLIDNNHTVDIGGGVDNAFGTSLTITGCTFIANTAANFGGAVVTGSDVTRITNSTFSGNEATYGGGGIYFFSTYPGSVTNSTITGNRAPGSGGGGGGIYINGGTITLTNDTIVGNSASIPGGGGIYSAGQSLTVTNSTIAMNAANGGGVGGGIIVNNTSPVTIANTIFAGNSPGNCAATNGGTITDGGYNLQSTGMSCGATVPVADPKLDPNGLRDNGGPTQTVALLPASPAIDTVPATGAHCPATDQRGTTRPQPAGGACDSGAYEYVPVQPTVSGTYTAGTGGQQLRVIGSGYQQGSQIVVDGIVQPASAVAQVADDGTAITASLPAHVAGVVTLTVRNPGNLTSVAIGNLTYVTPGTLPTPHPLAPTATVKPFSQAPHRPTPPPMGMGGSPTPTPLPLPLRR